MEWDSMGWDGFDGMGWDGFDGMGLMGWNGKGDLYGLLLNFILSMSRCFALIDECFFRRLNCPIPVSHFSSLHP